MNIGISPDFLPILNRVTMNSCTQNFVWIYIFKFLRYTQKWNNPSYGKYMLNVRNHPSVFQASCTILYSELQFLNILSNTCYFAFLIIAILMDVKWYLIVVLTQLSLVTNDIVHLFIYLSFRYVLWRNEYSSPLMMCSFL